MHEASALKVSALRAVEMTDADRTLWSDEERAWASRAAAEVVGANAAPETFLARRAALALERLEPRHPALARSVHALRWRPWVGTFLVIGAFGLGMFLDQVGGARRINILAPPVLGLLIWNIAVYVVLAAGYVIRYGDDATPGPLRGALVRVGGGLFRPRRRGGMRDAMLAFFDDWAHRSAPLYAVRAARILHLAAAALALGVVTGLYIRGLAFEYRATWESTFLQASTVHSILAFVYAPGAFVTGIAVPDVDAVSAVHAPAAENAARWVHLTAATVVLVVILPRLLLAFVYGMLERHRAARLPVSIDEPYFQRLLRNYRGGPARVRIIPYSYTPTPEVIAGLEVLLTRVFGGSVSTVAQPVPYGADDIAPSDTKAIRGSTIVALFNASGTPEREVHGTFLEKLVRQHSGGEAVVGLVDEGAWVERWGSDPARIASRRAAWRELAEEARVPVVFVDLSAPDLAGASDAIDAALAQSPRERR